MSENEGREEKQRIDSREPWSEKDSAIYMANKALDTPFADPDSDLCTISRQFLRAVEQLAKAKEDFDKLHTASNLTLNDLQKELKLRKELVGGLEYVKNYLEKGGFGRIDCKNKIEALLKKGT